MPYIITLSQKSDGTDVAECDYAGQHLQATSRHGVTFSMCRKLVALGAEDDVYECRGKDGKVRLIGLSIHRSAGLTVEDNEYGFRLAKYRIPSISSMA